MRVSQITVTRGTCKACGERVKGTAYLIGKEAPVYCSYACAFFELTLRENELVIAAI